MRSEAWLESKFDDLWRRYFADIRRINPVKVKFGRRAKRMLGSIRFDRKERTSTISVNRLLANLEVPAFVVTGVLAHELVHYASGFNSEHEKKQEYPHLGGVITKELAWRGLGEVAKLQKKWIHQNWKEFVKKNC